MANRERGQSILTLHEADKRMNEARFDRYDWCSLAA